ncbi:aspartate aminotransferase family protein [Acidocella aminolytica]|uniref:Aminotransferase, beta alanine--pyruvate transaminase n=1 Tax=Acidocella aminolytica 101 = DSM 11237 TaxID=1120923 RepID=A0A0D6PLX9_9PROT|nr:aspartate aminotransferase family protein [Acidocella aminolytica]GAN81784.1 aminotransferase, beta alanine--pyruvate transaminase [Acidocella aminolytica 101 = DSM 11237]GBQ35090.1 beta alanine--pyruvate transaminase [Acidocella aminolytica 101 = DSM 11237]SHE81224.1 beta-alanine--pyruvate transaminase [Acidocella aminolytica 101 = DSM 11237]
MSAATRSSNDPLIHHWMPFTANRQFHEQPRMITRAEGVYYYNTRGEKLLDGSSGLYCIPLGHGRREIREAVAKQMEELDYAPPFQYGVPTAFRLATEVAQMLPEGINRVFFGGSGSEAADTALKMALAYHRARGEAQRVRLIGRERGYHGVNLGGMSVGGMMPNRKAFSTGLPGVSHLRHTHIKENYFQMGEGEHGADLADDLERFVNLHGPDTIAACIVEPIAGSTGILVPPKGYLKRLREICTKHGILLIFDEVITGFGRTGEAFASQTFGVTPDIITMAKALTNGSIPMAAVAVKDEIQQAIFEAAPENGIELFHGYTYSAHPAACAAGLATLKIYREEGIFDRVKSLTPAFLEQVGSFKDVEGVVDTRGHGLLGAVELAPKGKPGERGFKILCKAFERGLVLRAAGDSMVLAPPFAATPDQISEMLDILRKLIQES